MVGHQTNQQFRRSPGATLLALWLLASFATALLGSNLKKLLRTVEALADLGPELTADRDFRQTTRTILSAVIEAAGAREAVLFAFGERPSMLTSLDAQGFRSHPRPGHYSSTPPSHPHAQRCRPERLLSTARTCDAYLSSNGNVAPELFRCICALKVRGKLVGAIALGRPSSDGAYEEDALAALEMIGSYVALAIQNHTLEPDAGATGGGKPAPARFAAWVLRQRAGSLRDRHRCQTREHSRPLAARGSLRAGDRRSARHGTERSRAAALGRLPARHRQSRCRYAPLRQALVARRRRIPRDARPHHGGPPDCQPRAISVAADS